MNDELVSPNWQDYANQLDAIDDDAYKTASIAQKTIHCDVASHQAEELKLLSSKWIQHIETGSGTSVHQAYALTLFERFCCSLDNVKTILEFGAGYGEMPRMILSSGWKGRYICYDLPSLIRFQRIHLRGDHHVRFISDPVDLHGLSPDLLIAICSLSEAPFALRERIFETHPDRILIRYQTSWDGADNLSYFKSIASDYEHAYRISAPAYPNHEFLIAHEHKANHARKNKRARTKIL